MTMALALIVSGVAMVPARAATALDPITTPGNPKCSDDGYSGFKIFLQRLCDNEPDNPDKKATWSYWCLYHALGL